MDESRIRTKMFADANESGYIRVDRALDYPLLKSQSEVQVRPHKANNLQL